MNSHWDDAVTRLEKSLRDILDNHPTPLGAEYRYAHLSLALIDAIFSIGARYSSTQQTVKRYADYSGLSLFRDSFDDWPNTTEQQPLSELVTQFKALGLETLTTEVFRNRQRTSTQNGILKAEAVRQAAMLLVDNNVEYFQDMPRIMNNSYFRQQFCQIKGQTSGISLSYFWMLTGSRDLIKPDRHVMTYLRRVSGNATLTETKALEMVQQVSKRLQSDFPHVSPRWLDYLIWNDQRRRDSNSKP
ncbi:hypothetical protein [Sulfobacillus thermosulfidooxidans]|uniref:hypothetical protein n=1 Tax=Sulfobacillus thermosulfidooxidans TaxID=28034 RepID=UPI0006B6553B|nr:hypothetical protein [Sulfobacillus thermosulfidooxidans]